MFCVYVYVVCARMFDVRMHMFVRCMYCVCAWDMCCLCAYVRCMCVSLVCGLVVCTCTEVY